MSFLSRWFGGTAPGDPLQNTPVQDWPRSDGQSPQVSLERQALESFGVRLPFGAPIDAARALGRPDSYRTHGERFVMLAYERWGLELEFEANALSQVSFLIGEVHRAENRPTLMLAEPQGPDGRTLSPQTTEQDLLQRFGQPETRQDLEERVVLYYDAGPLISEFQVEHGLLTGWDVYLD